MKMEAFPCPSRYIEGSEKIRNVVSHHGIMQANKLRKPARQTETSAAMKPIDRQVNPTLKGQVKTQYLALAPSGVRKYPYVRPERGTSIVKACLCHTHTKRMATTAAREGRSVFVRRNTTRLSQVAETPSATHQPTRTKGTASHPNRSPKSIVYGAALSMTTSGTIVASATCIVDAFSGTAFMCGSPGIEFFDDGELKHLSLASGDRLSQ